MSYYMLLSKDINGTFGPNATKQSIITSLKKNGKSTRKDFDQVGLESQVKPQRAMGPGGAQRGSAFSKWTVPSNLALLLGTEKKSSQEFADELGAFFGFTEEIGLAAPQRNEWLACVTFVDPDTAPTFQVVALVGASALAKAKVDWKKEDQPPKFWTTYVPTWMGKDTKKTFDIGRPFDGGGKW